MSQCVSVCVCVVWFTTTRSVCVLWMFSPLFRIPSVSSNYGLTFSPSASSWFLVRTMRHNLASIHFICFRSAFWQLTFSHFFFFHCSHPVVEEMIDWTMFCTYSAPHGGFMWYHFDPRLLMCIKNHVKTINTCIKVYDYNENPNSCIVELVNNALKWSDERLTGDGVSLSFSSYESCLLKRCLLYSSVWSKLKTPGQDLTKLLGISFGSESVDFKNASCA